MIKIYRPVCDISQDLTKCKSLTNKEKKLLKKKKKSRILTEQVG